MKTQSLKGKRDFARAFGKGQHFGNRHFHFYYIRNRKSTNRLGIIVSKKVSKRAVVRNLVRRRIREAYRLYEEHVMTGYDFIIIAKARAVQATYQELEHSLRHLFYKTHLEVKKK